MGGNHTLNRAKLCLICAGRASILITTVLLEVIRNVLFQDFTLENPCFPSGLCWTCGRTLYEYAKGKFERMIPEWFDYSQMRNYQLRRGETVCNCMICDMAENRYRFGAKNSKKRTCGNPKVMWLDNSSSKREIVRMCNYCITKIQVGSPHHCNRTGKIASIIQICSPGSLSTLKANLLKQDLTKNEEVKLMGKGRPVTVRKSTKKAEKTQV